MSEICPRCDNLTTKKALSSYNCCSSCHKSDQQIEKQKKKEQKYIDKMVKRLTSGSGKKRVSNLNF